ncbi:alpha-D-ribose 1-methylphosphonate 5-phosphate C-P-lyase PhnJ [Rhizobium puerariae]|uniref:Alpha-D-ribose 1-methylphosphonate 5-phosphate C-P lyase n=1 Tax=Rhizobium puerariae TaxID=1585791 RepID=A0ABV6AAC9_9HYPH
MIDDIDVGQEADSYSFGFLDEQTKRMIRRAILKAVSIPGYQVPFGDREVPLPPGWGTGGIQVTASIIGLPDRLKVIDQGADDTTNAVSIRRFFAHVASVATTEHTGEATIIQSRHRIPERPLADDQILVMQVPQPEPLRRLVTSEAQTRKLHAFARYGLMQVRLYEDIARYGNIVMSHDYPVRVHSRYLASPSPIPKFDNPKLDRSHALTIFGAGRERRIYAIPPFTEVRSLDFEDYPFEIQKWTECCALCGATDSYLDEALLDDSGNTQFVCSDTSYCNDRQSEGVPR